MRRPKHPMPASLIDLHYNAFTRFYEIEEDGITYQFQLEETRLIRDYFRWFRPGGGMLYPTVSRWYRDLPNDIKKRVNRIGDIKPVNDGFYPDVEYD